MLLAGSTVWFRYDTTAE